MLLYRLSNMQYNNACDLNVIDGLKRAERQKMMLRERADVGSIMRKLTFHPLEQLSLLKMVGY